MIVNFQKFQLIPSSLFVELFKLVDDSNFFKKFKYVLDCNNNLCRIVSIKFRDIRDGHLFCIDGPDGRFNYNFRAFGDFKIFLWVLCDAELEGKINEIIWVSGLRNNIKKLIGIDDGNFEKVKFLDKNEELALFFEGVVERLGNCFSIEGRYCAEDFCLLDVRLCLEWLNINSFSFGEGGFDEIFNFFSRAASDYDRSRLISARFAEKQALAFYKKYYSVKDVSIHQVTGESFLWKDFDIQADDRCFDVKNCRPSFSGGGNYVEHCVSEFKKNRKNGEDVTVVGVLSEYKKDDRDLLLLNFSCIVIGEVNVVDARKLFKWMRSKFGRHVDLSGMWGKGVVPGWMFEYSEDFYSGRGLAIEQLTIFLDDYIDSGNGLIELNPWVYLLDERFRSPPDFWGDLEKNIYFDLKSLQYEVGFSRRSLYLYILCFSLSEFVAGNSICNFLRAISFLIKTPGGVLFLLDPHKKGYIESLIELLFILDKNYLDLNFNKYVKFKMTHPLVLKGVDKSGSENSVVAYCGGWRVAPRVRCGKFPLVVGLNVYCDRCGFLICDDCGFCSLSCVDCEPRQFKIANGAVEEYSDDLVDGYF